ncbi:hypothetical protein DFH09DRAFT_1086835 [Mycena vulgaris]|nr:hypothetical protein DFH09DRAFT_1086835 [Mycena vulgaris]
MRSWEVPPPSRIMAKSLPPIEISLKAAQSENERFLRKLAGSRPPTTLASRVTNAHRSCGGDNFYQMCMGDQEPKRLGSWVIQCTSKTRKCKPVYSDPLESHIRNPLASELSKFQLVNKLANNLSANATKIFVGLITLRAASPVHEVAGVRLRTSASNYYLSRCINYGISGEKLDSLKRTLDNIDSSTLDNLPGVGMPGAKSKSKGKAKANTTLDSGEESNDGPKEHDRDSGRPSVGPDWRRRGGREREAEAEAEAEAKEGNGKGSVKDKVKEVKSKQDGDGEAGGQGAQGRKRKRAEKDGVEGPKAGKKARVAGKDPQGESSGSRRSTRARAPKSIAAPRAEALKGKAKPGWFMQAVSSDEGISEKKARGRTKLMIGPFCDVHVLITISLLFLPDFSRARARALGSSGSSGGDLDRAVNTWIERWRLDRAGRADRAARARCTLVV